MDKVVIKRKLTDKNTNLEYWLSKPVSERLAAIEMLRQQYLKFNYKNVQPQLQRVCRIIKQK